MIRKDAQPYLESLSFYYFEELGLVMCTCGNTYDDEDRAEEHWFEEHNTW